MTYSGPLRMPRMNIQALCALQPEIQCANCLMFLKKRLRCSQCKQTHYCSAHCQEIHWPVHSRECTKYTSPLDIIKFRTESKFNLDKLICFVQLFNGILQPIPFSSFDPQIHFGRFLVQVEDEFQFGDEFQSFVSTENNQIFYSQLQLRSYRPKSNYEQMCVVCASCKGPSLGTCRKCGHVQDINENENKILQEVLELKNYAEYHLMFSNNEIKCDLEKKMKAKININMELEEYIPKLTRLLKTNTAHHLSFPLYNCILLAFKLLANAPKTNYFKFVNNLLGEVDIYSLAFCLTKLSIHHFSRFSAVTFYNLQQICQVLNVYCLNELESKSLPPLMQEQNDQVEVSLEERARMKAVSIDLLQGHRNCLNFCQQLKEIAEETKDEYLMNETDRLVAQVDCRVENLESWAEEEYDQFSDELAIKGEQYTGEVGKERIDVMK
ncbi:MYND_finger domain-containing protein [Hexamita inflata]|uniref:MYND_finger domain-containing protein n=1 Tax=Hexamita inflata TaxID=28002 RepID=A0ABP1HJI9_9EUKA